MDNLFRQSLKVIIAQYPSVVPQLRGKARWYAFTRPNVYGLAMYMSREAIAYIDSARENKTAEYFLGTLQRLVRDVYGGFIAGEFIDIAANLIQGQINQAFNQAWKDEGTDEPIPDYLTAAAESIILNEYDHVDKFYRDIVDARIDKTSIDPLLARCSIWANRYNDAYNQAVALIVMKLGGNLIWIFGDTDHCDVCQRLNGIVARASEWEQLGVHPQQPENPLLTCGGWKCQCSLNATDQRRSPKAFTTIMNIVNK